MFGSMSGRKFSPNSAGNDFFSSNPSSTHVYSAYKSRKDISTRKFRHFSGRESGKLPFLEAWARSCLNPVWTKTAPDKNRGFPEFRALASKGIVRGPDRSRQTTDVVSNYRTISIKPTVTRHTPLCRCQNLVDVTRHGLGAVCRTSKLSQLPPLAPLVAKKSNFPWDSHRRLPNIGRPDINRLKSNLKF
jgi:hypothetical protein